MASLPGIRAKQYAGNDQTRATSNRVDLPADWSGTTGGSPGMSLEIFILEGELRLADVSLQSGGYAYLPPGTLGFNLKSDDGARILYFLEGVDDAAMIQHLYRAARAGVRIDLIVRGHCRLRPGLKDFSETIHVVSIVGRFLENSRLYYFHNDDDPQVFVGSADWMRRNLDDRVETVVPIEAPALKARLIALLHQTLADQRLAWDLHADGHYVQRHPASDDEAVGLHDLLMGQVQSSRFEVQGSKFVAETRAAGD